MSISNGPGLLFIMSEPAVIQREPGKNTNSVPPIERLPPEILVAIFEESIYTPELAVSEIPHFQKLHKLASVCVEWNRAVKGVPSLWAVLESNTPKEIVPRVLQRSGKCPLVIKCYPAVDQQDIGMDSGEVYPKARIWDDLKSFLMIAFSEIHRWRSALILINQADSEILQGLEKPAPVIEMVDIEICETPQRASIHLFAGQALNLRSIRLFGLPFLWSPGQFRGLRHLDISPPSASPSQPAIEDVMMTIKSSPRLQTLCLGYLRIPSPPIQDDLPTFRLGYLETLSLHGISTSIIQAILIRIRAPILQHLTIDTGYEDGGNDSCDIIEAIQHFLPMIHFSINRASAVNLILSRNSVDVYTSPAHPEPGAHINISIHHNSSPRRLQAFLDNMIHNSASHTPMTLWIPQVPAIQWSDLGKILGSLDGVVELSTDGLRVSHHDSVFRFLSTPSDAFGRQNRPFPNLKKLSLPFNAQGQRVVELVTARYGSGITDNSSSGQGEDRICSLTTLDVANIHLTPNQCTEIERILGHGVVQGLYYDCFVGR